MKTAPKAESPRWRDEPRSVVLGTAGHIDHGKTALVLALTGTDTDRLPEEKSRGITIDLGFASLQLADETGRTLDLSLIDVPGHHAFVRNMLAGAGGIDCVMLVIAADEGVKPQTEEHLAICTLLGIRHGLVALTKTDAVSAERLLQARTEVEAFVQQTILEKAVIVPVSARTGAGLAALKKEISSVVSRIPERGTDSVFRLPLDRSFSVRGFGTVVTGTLQAGTVTAGNTLELQPEARQVRVRGVQVHGKARGNAGAPNRVALNLAGIEVAEVKRGDTLVVPDTLTAVGTVDAEITMLAGAPQLRHRSRVRVHAFASETLATVLLFDTTEVSGPARGTLVRLQLAKPIVLAPGDRFVIRQPSPAITLGGGRVLDGHPMRRLRKAVTRTWLEQIRNAHAGEQILPRVQRRGLTGIRVVGLVPETGLKAETITRLIRPLLAEGLLVGSEGGTPALTGLLASEALKAAAELVHRELARPGVVLSRAQLQSRLRLESSVLDLALTKLQLEKGVFVTPQGVSLPEQGSAISTKQSGSLAAIDALYQAAGLASPILSEVSAKLGIGLKELPGLITVLLRQKKLVRLGADNLLVHANALAKLANDLQKQHRGATFDVSRFKSFTGLTRKHAIPLLEYLDAARVTRNVGGARTVL